VDVKKQLNIAIESGKVLFGSNKTIDSLLNGKPKLVLLSSNIQKKQKETITYYCSLSNTPCVTLKESSIEIGSSCGRSHPISSLTVMDVGESSILEVRE
jgi:large subunit ribosomal protein L30e